MSIKNCFRRTRDSVMSITDDFRCVHDFVMSMADCLRRMHDFVVSMTGGFRRGDNVAIRQERSGGRVANRVRGFAAGAPRGAGGFGAGL